MKRFSVRLASLIPTLPKLATLRQMESPIKVQHSAGLATAESERFPEYPQKSLRKRKAAVLRPQPASSDSELSPLSDEEPLIAKKPARKKRKVATKTKLAVNEGCSASADDDAEPLKTIRRNRKVKVAVAEEDILEYTQEDQMPKKRKRKAKVIEPVIYDIPDVERKETTFKGKPHPQVSAPLLMGHSPHFRSIRICTFLAPPISHCGTNTSITRPV
jgi:hypothetical protein